LPFCNLKLQGSRPRELPRGYPPEVRTLGDHVRKKRLDLGLQQRILAERLGVREETLATWERGHARPLPRHYGAIVRFLGYDPLLTSDTLAGRLRAVRLRLGFTHAELADRMHVDEGTIRDAERARRRLSRRTRALLEALVGAEQRCPGTLHGEDS